MNGRKSILLYIGLFFILLAVRAETGRLYTAAKLPSTLVNCICQDRYGYIWIGTDNGLCRFDGYRFIHYFHDRQDSSSLVDNSIVDFLVDREGNLWIGAAKGFMRYDYAANRFERFRFKGQDNRGLRALALVENKRGDILVGTSGYGLFRVDRQGKCLVPEKTFSGRPEDAFYSRMYEDRYGNLWRSSHRDVFSCYRREKGRVVIRDFRSPCGPPMAFLEHQGRLLVVCKQGMLTYDYASRKMRDAGYPMASLGKDISIRSAMADHDGNLYVGTTDQGVVMIPEGGQTPVTLHPEDHGSFDLSVANVNDIIEDKDHNLWVACHNKGVYLINRQDRPFRSMTFEGRNIPTGSGVSALAEARDGQIWCAVENSGLYLFAQDGSISRQQQAPVKTHLIYKDREGRYWTAAKNILYLWDDKAMTVKEVLKTDGTDIFCMTDDDRGKLYLSVYSKGLLVVDTKNGETRRLNMSQRSGHGYLCNDWVRALMIDHEGLLWAATSNGVACMNPENYHFDTYKWNKLLADVQTNALEETENGDILIGTDNGLYIFERQNNRCDLFPGSEELAGKRICGMTNDAEGNLWVSTTMGLWQWNKTQKKWISYLNGSGLETHEYAQGACLAMSDGRIVFGNPDGIVCFKPDQVNGQTGANRPVYLTGLNMEGKNVPCPGNNFFIPYKDNSFSLEFSLLNYQDAEHVRYLYRINEGEWTLTEEGGNDVQFHQMKPGKYTLEIKAVENGTPSDKTQTVSFRVGQPWYLTTWAKWIYVFLLGALVWSLFILYEKKRQRELNEQKMRFLIDATHDIKSPLTLIDGAVTKLKQHITDEEDLPYLESIEHNSERLMQLVTQILDTRRLDKGQMKPTCRETDMEDFLKGCCNLYTVYAEDKHIHIQLKCEDKNIKAWIDPELMDKVICNLLSNAVKFSFENGQIDVRLAKDANHVHISVIDSGIGLNEDEAGRLFERFYQGKHGEGIHYEGTGIGLNLCQAVVRLHGGEIKAHNRQDGQKGTCVDIVLPVGKSHLPQEYISRTSTTGTTDEKRKNFMMLPNILVVDDDTELTQFIRQEMDGWYNIDCAGNGKEALKKLLSHRYDLVVSDIKMPEMDGITLLKNVKKNDDLCDIPVILLTARSEVEEKLNSIRTGADGFIAKPFHLEELHAYIDNLLSNVKRLKGKFSGLINQQDHLKEIRIKNYDDLMMEKFITIVNKHISDPNFHMEQLHAEIGMSKVHLYRRFKNMTGVAPSDFIRELRLKQACKLMDEGNTDVLAIAAAVGFNSHSYFSTVFKRYKGVTPSEYIKNINPDKKTS